MSSFSIDKAEYIKVAGLLAGIAKATERGTFTKLWIYDDETKRNMIGEDYRRRLTECYLMNLRSVAEQYNDAESFADTDEYTAQYNQYWQIGRSLLNRPDRFQAAIMALNHFFDSSIYQTERDDYALYMRTFYGTIIRALLKLYTAHFSEDQIRGNWGSFNFTL